MPWRRAAIGTKKPPPERQRSSPIGEFGEYGELEGRNLSARSCYKARRRQLCGGGSWRQVSETRWEGGGRCWVVWRMTDVCVRGMNVCA